MGLELDEGYRESLETYVSRLSPRQTFPYFQARVDNELVKGWVAVNYLTDGETRYCHLGIFGETDPERPIYHLCGSRWRD